MNFSDIVQQRRAVKAFDAEHVISPAEEKQLLDLAFETPSSFNIQHWRLVKLTDKTLRENVREVAWGQAQVTDASIVYVICADTQAWQKNPARYWETSQQAQEALLPLIKSFYENQEQKQRDEALRSVGLIAQTLMLSATALGYESCPMIGFDAVAVAKLINLPADHVVGMMLAIGKGTKAAHAKGGYLPRSVTVVENTF